VSPGLGPNVDIANTLMDDLYRKERHGDANMTYSIPILNGDYQVVLHFAELSYVQQLKVSGNTGLCQYFCLTYVLCCPSQRQRQCGRTAHF
jgi:Malectin domain